MIPIFRKGEGLATHILRTDSVPDIMPTALEFPNPQDTDTVILMLADGSVEYWTYDLAIWGKKFESTTKISNKYTGVADTLATLPTARLDSTLLKEGDRAVLGKKDGVNEVGMYFWNGAIWQFGYKFDIVQLLTIVELGDKTNTVESNITGKLMDEVLEARVKGTEFTATDSLDALAMDDYPIMGSFKSGALKNGPKSAPNLEGSYVKKGSVVEFLFTTGKAGDVDDNSVWSIKAATPIVTDWKQISSLGLRSSPLLTLAELTAQVGVADGMEQDVRTGTSVKTYTFWKGKAADTNIIGVDSDDGVGRWGLTERGGLRGPNVVDATELTSIKAREYELRLRKDNKKEYVFKLTIDLTAGEVADANNLDDDAGTGKWVLLTSELIVYKTNTVSVSASLTDDLKVDLKGGIVRYIDSNSKVKELVVNDLANTPFTVVDKTGAPTPGTINNVIANPGDVIPKKVYENYTTGITDLVGADHATYISFYLKISDKSIYAQLGSSVYADIETGVTNHISEVKILPDLLSKECVFIGGFVVDNKTTKLRDSGYKVRATKLGEINIGMSVNTLKGAPNDVLIGQLFYDTNRAPFQGKLYAGSTYQWSDNPKLKELFDNTPHKFITDNLDGSFTIVDNKEFLRAGVSDIGKKLDNTTALNGISMAQSGGHRHRLRYSNDQNTRVDPGPGKNAMRGDAFGEKRNSYWNNPTYNDMDANGSHQHTLSSTDSETSPDHRTAYFGIFGDLSSIVIDSSLVALPTVAGSYRYVVDTTTGNGSFILDTPVQAKDVVFDDSAVSLDKKNVQEAVKQLSDKVDKLPATEYLNTFADLPTTGAKSDFAHVKDASGDPTVTAGWAKYEHDGTDWVKSTSQEDLMAADAIITDLQMADKTDVTQGNIKGGKSLFDRETALLMTAGDIVTGTKQEPTHVSPELLKNDIAELIRRMAVEVYDIDATHYSSTNPKSKYILYTDGVLYEAQKPNIPNGTALDTDDTNWLPVYAKKPKSSPRTIVDITVDTTLEYSITDDVLYTEGKRYIVTKEDAVLTFPPLKIGSIFIAADWKKRAGTAGNVYVTNGTDTVIRLTTGKTLADVDNQVLPVDGHGFVEFIADVANNRWIIQH